MSERERAEEALRKSEEKYRHIFESIVDVYAELAMDGTILEVSPSIEQMMGYGREELLGKSAVGFYAHPEERAEIMESILRTGRLDDTEVSLKHKDGRELICSFSEKLVSDAEGKPAKLILTARDITERKRMEEELRKHGDELEEVVAGRTAELTETVRQLQEEIYERECMQEALSESERRYRLLAENASDVIWTLDIESIHFTYISPSIEAVRGYTVEESMAQTLEEALTPASLEIATKALAEELAAENAEQSDPTRSRTLELEQTCKDGSAIWVEITMTFVRDADGRPVEILGVTREISERKQAEEVIRRTRDELEQRVKEQATTIEILDLVNSSANTRETIRQLIIRLRDWSGCDAVGVRLRDGYDFPYFETTGFSEEFVRAESRLCAIDQKEELVRDSEGNPVLECMCGNVICGRYDPAMPFFTEQGSFWTNRTSDLQAGASEADRQGHTRDRCNGEGYESVALVALRSGGETFGLMQFNDERSDRFTSERISFLERLAYNISNALARKQAEEALSESEERYRTLVDNSLTGVVVHQDGKLQFVSKQITEWWGYTREELLGASTLDVLIHPDDRGRVRELVARRMSDESFREHGQFRVVAKNGDILWVETLGTVIQYRGKPAILVNIVDVTDRRQARELVEKSEEKYRQVVDNAYETILVAQDGMLMFVNPEAVKSMGYSEDELTSMPFIEFIHPDDREMMVQNFLRRLKGEEFASTYEFRFIHKDGNVRWAQINAVLINWEDRPATLNFLIDITDRKRAEEEREKLEAQLQRAQKMEAIGTLAGGVAHDLNNILSGIVSYPELLLLDLPEDSPLRRPIRTIQESGEKAATIVQDMLTLARRGITAAEVVNLNDVISDYLRTPECEKLKSFHPNIQLNTELDTDVLNIFGSPVHLSKTVMNLVSNAAEAMPDGGEILISSANRYLDKPVRGYDQIEEGDYVVLTVSDTGIGLSPQDTERIFEPFYTKKVMGRSGTGLGTAVVWATVKDHKGYVDVQSEEGKGTTFTLYFPVTRKELAEEKSRLFIEDYLGKGESILVVDDVRGQREIASGILKRLRYSVASVASGEEAVEYMKAHSADLVVLDMIMDPGIDGLETYKRIIELHPGQKAIITSGFSETDRVKQAHSLGAGTYIRKPYTLEKIGTAVRSELDK